VARLSAGPGHISALAFSRDGRLLASGGGGGAILVWEVSGGEGLPGTVTADEAAALWQALGDAEAARANHALAALAAASAQALPLVKERFQAARKKPDEKELARLIADLDADAFKVRQRANRELAEAGPDAAAALRAALKGEPTPEAKRRIEELLARIGKKIAPPEELRSLRAVEVLERIGTPQARALLEELAGRKAPPQVLAEIRASLARMQGR
jgi:hypothetical protein